MSGKKSEYAEEESEEYEKKVTFLFLSPEEHVLIRPDTYVGSIEKQKKEVWILNETKTEMIEETIEYVPGLFKIFDEILVNAADNKQRDEEMKKIEVTINEKEKYIEIINDGKGLPIGIHKEYNCQIIELIFGHLLTSSNYNDKKKKTVGGRNGFGAKLTNIFSKRFEIETIDKIKKKRYEQIWKNNMKEKEEAKITDCKNKNSYTRVRFYPDFEKFGMIGFEKGIIKLIEKRVYDIAGTTWSKLKVYLNGLLININSFEEYNKEYFIYKEKDNNRWEIIIGLSIEQEYKQISHVNNIWTMKGGNHVKYIIEQIIDYIRNNYKTKIKSIGNINDIKNILKPQFIKDQIFIFINCLIENPSFSSQTKEEMILKKTNFGSEYDRIQFKIKQDSKKTDGKKNNNKKLRLDPDIIDANDAGPGSNCVLILVEGKSAKSYALGGVSVLPGGRNKYGIFPLRGKLLNVRDENKLKISKNKEISNLKQLLGLREDVNYNDLNIFETLRYEKIMIMTDQDYDGSHIKGLIINYFHNGWPELIIKNGFLTQFITPIVMVSKKHNNNNNNKISFYTIPEYEIWKQLHNNGKGWIIEYYKGLGTWEISQGKQHFKQLKQHCIEFKYKDIKDDESLIKAFDKKKAADRKQWLAEYRSGTYLNFKENVYYQDFVNKELILYAIEDNKRSIPSIIDGFKPSQRKIIYSCFLRKLINKIRVAQLSGYVSEKTAYHHGEASLCQTIIGLAQNFVGSNNINLLQPKGFFGTRLKGGKDSSQPRYIYTNLTKITRNIFISHDDSILNYLDDDGFPVEPDFYIPIIPMILVNGAQGIGNGYSTFIPNFNPKDIIHNIRTKLNHTNHSWNFMIPWYRGSTSPILTIFPKDNINHIGVNFRTIGNCQISILNQDKARIQITELPIGMWTETYHEFLYDLEENGSIDSFRNLSSDVDVLFEVDITLNKSNSLSLSNDDKKSKKNKDDTIKNSKRIIFNGILNLQFLKDMNLIDSLHTTNMVLFDRNQQLKRYECVEDILQEFFEVRWKYYENRKNSLIAQIKHLLEKTSQQARFISIKNSFIKKYGR
ncbi:hypothetical protein RFI_01798 [Reticulomyxa filosa]|uniref:DNA topoisomerase 2 n=1 Tax=Reticulomyxa filosa TaxID=46433 RepID=X6P9N5_RETFI|nr:hypothetical protein RFI_01798 [Reticulomyxa filosa]|eukprot:ETO35265.1 hypothetical protein RFI_01798 [Reticulomyxa filosa]